MRPPAYTDRVERLSSGVVSGRLRLGLATAVLAIGVLTVLLDGFGNTRRQEWIGAVQIVVAAVVLVWLLEAGGVRWPRLLLAAAVAGAVGWLISVRFDDLAPLYLFVLVCWIQLSGSRRDALIATGLAALAVTPTLRYDPTTWLTWTIGVVSLSAGIGAILEQRRLLVDLRAAQADLANAAAAAERRRIAREVHDLIAHSLSVTILHLTAARHVLQRDPARAAEALAGGRAARAARAWPTSDGRSACSTLDHPLPTSHGAAAHRRRDSHRSSRSTAEQDWTSHSTSGGIVRGAAGRHRPGSLPHRARGVGERRQARARAAGWR